MLCVNIQLAGVVGADAQSNSANTLPSVIYIRLLNNLKKCCQSQLRYVLPDHHVGLSVNPHAIVVFVLLHSLVLEENSK